MIFLCAERLSDLVFGAKRLQDLFCFREVAGFFLVLGGSMIFFCGERLNDFFFGAKRL